MTDPVEIEAANCIAPLINTATRVRQGALAITTSVAGADIGSLLTKGKDGHFVTLFNDGAENIYFFFNNSAAGTPVPADMGTGVGVCSCIPPAGFFPVRLVDDYTFIRALTSTGTATLRYFISSKGSAQHARDI
jgi:hypothetical protein